MLSLLVLLAACGIPASTGTAPTIDSRAAATATPTVTDAAPVTITWAMWGNAEELVSHQRVATIFQTTHPTITVEIEHTPWEEYHPRLQAQIESGNLREIPDVLFLAQDLNRYAEAGLLEDLRPWIERTGYDLSDYWPSVVEQATVNGGIYGLQRDLDLSVLYYNRDLFDDADLAYPTDQWTWEDWAEAAAKLTAIGASGETERYGLAMEAGKWRTLLAQSRGGFFDDVLNPSACTLDSPRSIRAVQFYYDLLDDGYAMRPADLATAGGDAAAFREGKAAMIVQNASRIPTFNAAGMNYDVAPIPIPPGGWRVNNLGGARWVMSSNSANKEAAWVFLDWLQSPDGGMRIYTSESNIFPAIRSVAAAWAFNTATSQLPANRPAFLLEASRLQDVTLTNSPQWNEINDTVIEPNLQRIWSGEAAPARTIAQVCSQIEAYLAEEGFPRSGPAPQ